MNQWTSLQQIRSTVEKKWEKGIFLKEVLEPDNLFPLRIPLRGPNATELSEHFDRAREWISQYTNNNHKNQYLDVQWQRINHRLLGTNEIPVAVTFDSLEHLVTYIGKKRELNLFISLKDELLSPFPQLQEWLLKNPMLILDLSSVWSRLIKVAQWIQNNPQPGIYMRQISISDIDTKFIEQHKKILSEWLDIILDQSDFFTRHTGIKGFEQRYGFLTKPPLIRFRFIDKSCFIQGLSDLSLRADEFCTLSPHVDTVFVTENDINGLTFPDVSRAMVIFGRGYGFDSLKNAHWLRNKRIFYWGDIDTHGFAILNQFRSIFPQTVSMLMDPQTLIAHRNLWVNESTPVKASLESLSKEERSLYDDLLNNTYGDSVRLEQEVVSYNILVKFLKQLKNFEN